MQSIWRWNLKKCSVDIPKCLQTFSELIVKTIENKGVYTEVELSDMLCALLVKDSKGGNKLMMILFNLNSSCINYVDHTFKNMDESDLLEEPFNLCEDGTLDIAKIDLSILINLTPTKPGDTK